MVLKISGLVFKGKTGNKQRSKFHESCAKDSTVLTCSLTHKVITARKGKDKSPPTLSYYINFPIRNPIRIFSELVRSLLGEVFLSKLIIEIHFPGGLFKLLNEFFEEILTHYLTETKASILCCSH